MRHTTMLPPRSMSWTILIATACVFGAAGIGIGVSLNDRDSGHKPSMPLVTTMAERAGYPSSFVTDSSVLSDDAIFTVVRMQINAEMFDEKDVEVVGIQVQDGTLILVSSTNSPIVTKAVDVIPVAGGRVTVTRRDGDTHFPTRYTVDILRGESAGLTLVDTDFDGAFDQQFKTEAETQTEPMSDTGTRKREPESGTGSISDTPANDDEPNKARNDP